MLCACIFVGFAEAMRAVLVLRTAYIHGIPGRHDRTNERSMEVRAAGGAAHSEPHYGY
jgi:hypothetical protein